MVDQSTERTEHGLRRRNAIRALGGVGAAGLLTGCSSNIDVLSGGDFEDGRRNIVFVNSDDHRYDFLSSMNEPGTPTFLETPNMDRMAKEGAHLKNASVSTPLCAPCRASILTGQYAHQHGVIDNQHIKTDHVPFFHKYLHDEGYETAYIGKWHTYQLNSAEPRPGFDHWVSFEGQGHYFDQTLNVNGKKVERKGYITDILTEYARDWLKNREGDKPFFLFLSHKAPHAWFCPAPRHRNQYANASIEYPKTMADTEENYTGKPDWVQNQRESVRGVNYIFGGRFDFDELYRRYSETLLALDESIGAVMDQLNESGVADSTLMLYMSDNGYSLGEHGLIGKQTAYEPSIRVPMLAYAPGMIEPGTVVDEHVTNIDIAPTILAEANRSPPDYMSGRSFLPALSGRDMSESKEPFYESYWGGFPKHPTMFSTRQGKYKYIWYYGPSKDELYDLEADPLEQHNLLGKKKHEKRHEAMHDRLFDWIEANGGVPIPLQRSRRGNQNKKRPEDAPKTVPNDFT
ncbi:sulfatase family protein [Halococcus salifodinae]|uniref:N-acetylglucosamine-6-sulfatase n=1 Tax=Halococcus salifodinae DSM 8989 TaxID=1227456 RepID=M0MRZ0_9EURY|nr:sulfatase [Halococcus salifodinae]EMA48128.1 N-acetylglucosamine-6-sulfatase [Halococcus salifodinae DSM 8989]